MCKLEIVTILNRKRLLEIVIISLFRFIQKILTSTLRIFASVHEIEATIAQLEATIITEAWF